MDGSSSPKERLTLVRRPSSRLWRVSRSISSLRIVRRDRLFRHRLATSRRYPRSRLRWFQLRRRSGRDVQDRQSSPSAASPGEALRPERQAGSRGKGGWIPRRRRQLGLLLLLPVSHLGSADNHAPFARNAFSIARACALCHHSALAGGGGKAAGMGVLLMSGIDLGSGPPPSWSASFGARGCRRLSVGRSAIGPMSCSPGRADVDVLSARWASLLVRVGRDPRAWLSDFARGDVPETLEETRIGRSTQPL